MNITVSKEILDQLDLTGMEPGDWFLFCEKCLFQAGKGVGMKPECPNCGNRLIIATVTEDDVVRDSWYDDPDIPDRFRSIHLPASRRGHFLCTLERDQFTLIFSNGDIVLMEPSIAAHFRNIYQGEEKDD